MRSTVLPVLLALSTPAAAGGYGLEPQCRAGDHGACMLVCGEQVEVCDKGSKKYDKDACNDFAKDVPTCEGLDALTPGTLCRMPVTRLSPTQGAVGGFAVSCKEAKLEEKGKKSLRRYLAARPVPTILGPDDKVYLTDRHHMSTALLRADIDAERKEVFACIAANHPDMETDAFWQMMQATGAAWLHDRQGAPIAPDALPPDLASLADDPYRTLSRWVRDSCGYIKCGTECGGDGGGDTSKLATCEADSVPPWFLEFKWADYLREEIVLDGIYDLEGTAQAELLQQHLEGAIELSRLHDVADEGLPGWNGALIKPELVSFDEETFCEDD